MTIRVAIFLALIAVWIVAVALYKERHGKNRK